MTEEAGEVYLDYAATTPMDPRVVERMLPWLDAAGFGNPSSLHLTGRRAAEAVELARGEVAALLGAAAEEIVWTSGATEANNLAILGAGRAQPEGRRHVVSVRSEHSSVLGACGQLVKEGFELSLLDVEADGRLDLDRLAAALRPQTALVSLMYVNNETGAVAELAEAAERVKRSGALLHVDAVQAAGRLSIDLARLPVDLLSVSAHKLYGPKGVGALYVRRRPRVRLQPQQFGGGQEGGLRPGTLPTHQIVGMGVAFRLAGVEMAAERIRVARLKSRLWQGLQALGGVVLNGMPQGAPHILNVGFVGVHGEALAAELTGLAVSGSSACTAAQGGVSHVLRAMGVPEQLAHSSLRLSMGRYTTEQDIDFAVRALGEAVGRLRDLSPVWHEFAAGASLAALYGPMRGATDAAN